MYNYFVSQLYESLIYLPLFYLVYIVHRYYIQVKLRQNFYKKQFGEDLVVEYYPYLGILHRLRQGRIKYGDSAHYWKEFTRKYPGKKGIISNIGYKTMIEITDIGLAKEYVAQIYGNFVGDPIYFTNVFLQMNEATLGDMEGEMWKQHRFLMGYAFNFENLVKYVPVVCDITQEYLNQWFIEDAAKNNQVTMGLKKRISIIIGEVILRTFFGMSFVGQMYDGEPLHIKLLEFRERAGLRQKSARVVMTGFWITRLNIFPEDRRIYFAYHKMKNYFKQKIQKRKDMILQNKNLENPHLKGSRSFLDFLLEKHLEEIKIMEQGGKIQTHLSIDIIAVHLMGLIAGSMDNIGNFMTGVAYKLSGDQSFLDTIHQETSQIIRDPNNIQLVYSDLSEFKYLDAFLKEALRFYTPTPTQRQRNARKDCYIGKIKILKDTIVDYYAIAQFFSDEHYEQPNEFLPSRWMKENPPYKDSYAYVPFGVGQRNCIGQHIAIIMHKVILAIISQKCSRVEIIDKIDRLVMVNRLTYEPEEEIRFLFHPRKLNI